MTVDLRCLVLTPAPLGGIPDLVRPLPDGVDLVAGDVGAEELHRSRKRRARPPATRAGIEDPDLAEPPVAAPAPDRPELPAEGDRAERVGRTRERRPAAPAIARRVVDEDVGSLALVPAADHPQLPVERDDRVVRARLGQRGARLPLVAARVVGVHLAAAAVRRRAAHDVEPASQRGALGGADRLGQPAPRLPHAAIRVEALHAVEVPPGIADHPARHVDPPAELGRGDVAAPVRHRRREAPRARRRDLLGLVSPAPAPGGEAAASRTR